MNVRS